MDYGTDGDSRAAHCRRWSGDERSGGGRGGEALPGERGIDASELEVIIVATVTPDMFFPATACLVQDRLGAKGAWGFDLSAACSGFPLCAAGGSEAGGERRA